MRGIHISCDTLLSLEEEDVFSFLEAMKMRGKMMMGNT